MVKKDYETCSITIEDLLKVDIILASQNYEGFDENGDDPYNLSDG